MLGLFGTLSMANRSLQTQRAGTEVAGLSRALAPFASAIHAYDVSAALTYVKDGAILPRNRQ